MKFVARIIALSVLLTATVSGNVSAGEFRAGAAAVDITPTEFPVVVNGGMLDMTRRDVKRVPRRAGTYEGAQVIAPLRSSYDSGWATYNTTM